MDILELFEKTKLSFAKLQSQGKCYNYPVKLREDVLILLEHYSVQSLCGTLGITSKTIRNWLDAKNKPEAQSNFISLTLPDETTLAASTIVKELTLQLPQGLSLDLSNQSVDQAVKFICHLVKEFSQCSI